MPFPHAGQNILEMELETADGELTPANNRVVVAAEGVRENLRVLLVSGEPHAGERTWRNLLKSDAAVDLVHFTILRPPEKQDGTPINQLSLIAFPTRELFVEKIDEFDLIIFDRYKLRGILPASYFSNIRDYVLQGGAVLVSAGPDFASAESIFYSSLAEILPAAPTGRVIDGGFKPALTALGHRHPVTEGLEAFAPGAARGAKALVGFLAAHRRSGKPDGQVVMQGPDARPLLVLNRVGRVDRPSCLGSGLACRGYEGGGRSWNFCGGLRTG